MDKYCVTRLKTEINLCGQVFVISTVLLSYSSLYNDFVTFH